MIETAIAAAPDAIAVVSGREQLSYAALDARAGRLATALRSAGVGTESVVGLMIDRSVDLIVAILATFRAGGAFLPLDPALPAGRLAAMVEDARPVVILASEHRETAAALGVVLDPRRPIVDSCDDGERAGENHPLSLAYVLFTSGTTGRPKGVGNTHEALANRIDWMQRAYGAGPHDRILQKTPTSFDVSVWELLWPLTVGACVVMARPDGHRDLPYLHRVVRVAAITRLHFVPSMLDAFLRDGIERPFPWLRQIVVSGEALTPALAKRLRSALPAVSLDNLYGPTEAAIDVTAHHVSGDDDPMPIGCEIDNIVLRVVDRRLCPQPDGDQGELGITGIGLARGYLRRPDLTAASFVPDRAGAAGTRIYRTGDLGVRRDDGALLYRGRLDHQVKLNGQRIELLEVEAAVGSCMGGAACVATVETVGRGQMLVGYVVADASITGPAHEAWVAMRDAAVRNAPMTAVGRLEAEVSATPRPAVSCDGLDLAIEALAALPPADARHIILSGVAHRLPGIDAFEAMLGHAHAALAPDGRLSIEAVIDPRAIDDEGEAVGPGAVASLSVREPGLLVSPDWVRRWAARRGGTAEIDHDPVVAERYRATIDFSRRDTDPVDEPGMVTWPAWPMVNARIEAVVAERLAAVLPLHMHPSAFVALSSMPVTVNGKADRGRLPRLADLNTVANEHVPPIAETPLSRWWADVLGHAPVAADEDFFRVGGDSIQAIRLSARAHAAGWLLSPADIHRERTLSAMAERLSPLKDRPVRSAASAPVPVTLPPFVSGMLQETMAWPGLGLNIEQLVFDVDEIDRERWQCAWNAMIDAHAMFHAGFTADRSGLGVVSRKGCGLPIEWCDLSDQPEQSREDLWRQWIEKDAVTPFALDNAPLMRMRMTRWDERTWRAAWTLHHALTDGWSYAVALADVHAAYRALEQDAIPELHIGTDFADWCRWRADHVPTVEDARFWRRYLTTVAGPQARAFGPAVEAPRIAILESQIDRTAWNALQDAATMSGFGAFAMLQAIWDDAVRATWPSARMGALHAVRPATLPGMERIVGPLFTVLPVARPRGASLRERIAEFAADVVLKHDRLTVDPVYLSSIDPDGGVFDAIMVYENTPPIVTAGWLRDICVRSRFNQPLVVLIWPGDEGLAIDIYVDFARVSPNDAERLRDRFVAALRDAPNRLNDDTSDDDAMETVDEDLVDMSL